MIPNHDGPDIAGSYQTLTGHAIDPSWTLFSHKAAEGQRTHDRAWRVRWPWMREQTQLRYRGLYHWLRSDSTPKAQADHALQIMTIAEFGAPGDIWQVDWEVTPGIPLITSTQVGEYCDRIRQVRGDDRLIVYSSDWLPDSVLDVDTRREFFEWRDENPNDAYWHANYNTSDSEWGGWAEIDQFDAAVWQWTSRHQHPSIESTSGGFDMNHIRDHVRLDQIAGYPNQWSSPLSALHMCTPERRLIDTRPGPDHIGHLGDPVLNKRVVADSSFAILIPAVHGVVGQAAVLTITSADAAGDGHVALWGQLVGPTSKLNFSAHDPSPQSNTTLVQIDTSGPDPVVRGVIRNSDAHLIVDLIAVIA